MRYLRQIRDDLRGATTIEYAIFAVFAAVVMMSGLSSIGGSLNGTFDKAGQAMAAMPAHPGEGFAKAKTGDSRLVHVADTQDSFVQTSK